MAALTTNVVPNTGLRIDTLFVAASGGGDTCPTGAGVNLIYKNTGSAITVTIAYPNAYDGDQTVAGRTFTIPATTGEFVIPVRDVYRNPATGVASITYSGVTGLTVACVRTQVDG